jgi:hypothetical protein
VTVLKASRQKESAPLAEIGAAEEHAKLRLAVQAAGCLSFDWDVAANAIAWDGALDVLPVRDRGRGHLFLEAIGREHRAALQAVLDTNAPQATSFLLDLEMASAMGAVAFTMVGTRLPGDQGRTARLVGLLRETTERTREVQRLTYLATRDEVTGHLNRNALREELAQAI